MSIFRKMADGILSDVWDFVDDGYWEKREYPDYHKDTIKNRIHYQIFRITIDIINRMRDWCCVIDRFVKRGRI